MTTMEQRKRTRRGCGCAVAFILALLAVWVSFRMSGFSTSKTTAIQMRTVSNGVQIAMALLQYAEMNGGHFPDAEGKHFKSSNDVFRELFKRGIVSNERIFASSNLAFVPDGDCGGSPGFEEALKPGECGWMLLKHQTNSSHPKAPILIESAVGGSWPPRWELPPRPFDWFWLGWAKPVQPNKKGRAWSNRLVMAVFADGRADRVRLTPEGTLDLKSLPGAGAWLESLTPDQIAKLEYWDVEEKKTP